MSSRTGRRVTGEKERVRVLSDLSRRSGLAAMVGDVLGPVLAHLWDSYSGAYCTYGRLYFLSLPPEWLFGVHQASLGDIISTRRRVGVKSSDQSW
jgi:hypothetical protein